MVKPGSTAYYELHYWPGSKVIARWAIAQDGEARQVSPAAIAKARAKGKTIHKIVHIKRDMKVQLD